MNGEPLRSDFPSTRLQIFEAVKNGRVENQREAVSNFVERYWGPMVRFVRWTPLSFPSFRLDPEDVVQEFMQTQVLENCFLVKFNPAKGRFRTFLKTSLRRFYLNLLRKDSKTVDADPVSIDDKPNVEAEFAQDPGSAAFDYSWAVNILAETARRLKQNCRTPKAQLEWAVFAARIIYPLTRNCESLDNPAIAARFNLEDAVEAGRIFYDAKQKFRRILRAVLAEYPGNGADLDREVSEWLAILFSPTPVTVSLEQPLYPERCADVLRTVTDGKRQHWEASVFQDLWRHVLCASSDVTAWKNTAFADSAPDSTRNTICDLLHRASPPMEQLVKLHRWAKLAFQAAESLLPPDMCGALYYGAAVVCLAKHKSRISTLDEAKFRSGIAWALRQKWLDEKTKQLFRNTLSLMDTLDWNSLPCVG